MNGIELLSKANKDVKWVISTDNDFAGAGFRQNIRDAITRGNPSANIEIEQPASFLYKDWNDQVRNQIRSPEELQKTADKMGLSTDFVKMEVDAYKSKFPSADLTAFEGIGSKAADKAAEQAEVEKAKTIQIQRPHSKFGFTSPVLNGGNKQAESEAKRLADEEAAKQRGPVQRM
ncbi:hypothetical protein G3A39_43360 [Paraburkholderia aspalathi]|nr:hypothetical protein [Paraburkholderia aspalathi]